ncbi:hypothetical protein [Caminibacter sp.]
MAKQKNKKVNMELVNQRINQKLKLLNTYPNSWVYEFSNPTVRTNFRIPVRLIELANNAFKEFWGFYVNNEDVKKVEQIINKVEEKAKDVIELAGELGSGLVNFRIDDLERMRKYEKERLIKNSRAITELIIPQNDTFKTIYEAVVLIDKFDLPIKQNRNIEEVEKWIETVQDFMKTLKQAESELIKYTAEKLEPKYLGRYKALRNEVVKYLNAVKEETNENENPTEE